MAPVAIGIAGQIGSGKSTIATGLQMHLGGTLVSFGGYVRAEARLRGLDGSRETLQNLGEHLIGERGWDRFCRDTLDHFGWHPGSTVVIDGVRHVEVVDCLRRLVSPTRFVLVYVSIDEHSRTTRLPQEMVADETRRRQIESHPTEAQVPQALVAVADLMVDGATPPETIVQAIAAWVAQGSRHRYGSVTCGTPRRS